MRRNGATAMTINRSNLQALTDFPTRGEGKGPRQACFVQFPRLGFHIALAVFVLIALKVLPVRAQTPTPSPSPAAPLVNPCPTALMPGQTLIPVPVIGSGGGKLQGTLILSDEQEW